MNDTRERIMLTDRQWTRLGVVVAMLVAMASVATWFVARVGCGQPVPTCRVVFEESSPHVVMSSPACAQWVYDWSKDFVERNRWHEPLTDDEKRGIVP